MNEKSFVFDSVGFENIWGTEPETVERFCKEAKKFGATHVVVNNILPDPYPVQLLENPENHYLWLTLWGPSLDKFVSSKLNYGLYPEIWLSKNRQALLQIVKIVVARGMKPILRCGEPRFVPERFFKKYPHLRGPRVDNPAASTFPLYSLCTDIPEVQEHYREMMMKLMSYAPQIDALILFSGDSGAGFCHSPNLYPGPNGPRYCKKYTSAQRMLRFINILKEAGRKVNPNFYVLMHGYIGCKERDEILSRSRESDGISAICHGKYSHGGGLEDYYACYQYGSKIDEVGYDKAREERVKDLKENIDTLRKYGRQAIVAFNAPLEQWFHPLQYVPYPYQHLEILKIMYEMKIKDLFMYGRMTDPTLVPYDVNARAIQKYFHNPEKTPDDIVQSIAEEWVTEKHTSALIKAWKLCDEAVRKRPLWLHAFGYDTRFLPGPLVPDIDKVTEEERAYYYTITHANQETIPGAHFLNKLRRDENERSWMIKRYRSLVFPLLEKAEKILRGEIAKTTSAKIKDCLENQANYIYLFFLWQKCQYNWLEAGRYLAPGKGKPLIERSLVEIIDSEIKVTKRMIELLSGHLEHYIVVNSLPNIHQRGPQFLQDLECRISLMKKHRNDKYQPVVDPFPEIPW